MHYFRHVIWFLNLVLLLQTVKSEIIESIERAIDLIHKSAAKRGGPLTAEERKSLQ